MLRPKFDILDEHRVDYAETFPFFHRATNLTRKPRWTQIIVVRVIYEQILAGWFKGIPEKNFGGPPNTVFGHDCADCSSLRFRIVLAVHQHYIGLEICV